MFTRLYKPLSGAFRPVVTSHYFSMGSPGSTELPLRVLLIATVTRVQLVRVQGKARARKSRRLRSARGGPPSYPRVPGLSSPSPGLPLEPS